MMKSLVLIGGRGKAGGIKRAKSLNEAKSFAKEMLGKEIRGYVVDMLMLEHAVEETGACYVGVTMNPANYNNILMGITRNSAIKVARDELGVETIERTIDRGELYIADECFLTGTAAHITPVAEIDRRKVGNGEIGEITGKLQKIYFEVIRGDNPKYLDWCTPVYKK